MTGDERSIQPVPGKVPEVENTMMTRKPAAQASAATSAGGRSCESAAARARRARARRVSAVGLAWRVAGPGECAGRRRRTR